MRAIDIFTLLFLYPCQAWKLSYPSSQNLRFLRPRVVKKASSTPAFTRINMSKDKIGRGESRFVQSKRKILSEEKKKKTTPIESTPDTSLPSQSSSERTTINLVKTIVGAGVLTLPCGMARLSENGVLPTEIIVISTTLLVVFGGLAAFGFSLVGSICARTNAKTYSEAWGRTVSEDTTWLPSIIAVSLCFTGSVKCLTTLGDVLSDILAYGIHVPVDSIPRDPLLLTTVLTVLLPLCLLPSLSPLAAGSLLGITGVVVSALAMIVRFTDGTYAPGGLFYDVLTWKPVFNTFVSPSSVVVDSTVNAAAASFFVNLLDNEYIKHQPSLANIAVFLALCSDAYLAHFSAPSLFNEVKPRQGGNASDLTPTENKLSVFNEAVERAFLISVVLFILIAISGFATFGSNSQPIILNNYASSDGLAAISRIGLGACVLFEFPLLERPFRKTMLKDVLDRPDLATSPIMTVFSVALITFTSLLGVPIDKLSAISGGIGGSFLIYIAPALMSLRALNVVKKDDSPRKLLDDITDTAEKVEYVTLGGIGIVLSILASSKIIGESLPIY